MSRRRRAPFHLYANDWLFKLREKIFCLPGPRNRSVPVHSLGSANFSWFNTGMRVYWGFFFSTNYVQVQSSYCTSTVATKWNGERSNERPNKRVDYHTYGTSTVITVNYCTVPVQVLEYESAALRSAFW